MQLSIWPAVERGRQYAFPAVWVAVFATGVGLSEPLPSLDVAPYLSFAPIGPANGISETQSAAEAPLMARISGSFSPSALSRRLIIWVS